MRRVSLIALSVLGAAGCAAMMEVQLDPTVRERLGAGPPIHVVHYAAKPLDYVRSVLERQDAFHDIPGLDAPVEEIERAFLDALREEAGLPNLSRSERPLWIERRMLPLGVTWERASAHGYPMTDLPSEWYRDGLMIELETLNWRIDGSGPTRLLGRCTLEFGLRARLVRLTDGTVLWRCFCQSAHPRQCNDLVADDLKLLRSLRAELATRCAAELVGAFMGRTERSIWDGTHE